MGKDKYEYLPNTADMALSNSCYYYDWIYYVPQDKFEDTIGWIRSLKIP
jgi:hypothetical protein